MMDAQNKDQTLFPDINADEESGVTSIESLCVSCEENGTTRLLLTRIPFFREVVISSFDCPHCGYSNNEVQSAGRIQDNGCKVTLSVQSEKDLSRQVIKSDAASFIIPELEFESPAFTQKGELNTIEGLLEKAVSGLQQGQPVRKIIDPITADKIDSIILLLTKCKEGQMKFTLVVDDISGNSFIENPHAPEKDPLMKVEYYTRQPEQDAKLGLQPADEKAQEEENIEREEDEGGNVKDEVLNFATNCTACNAPVETRMKVVSIPHFKEVIVMATVCDACGHKTNEVKSGSGVEPRGTRLTLTITDPADMNRDVLKSETCEIIVPSLEFVSAAGLSSGRFTTLEGLLTNVKDQLQSINPFGLGDSPGVFNEKLKTFLSGLDKIISGEELGVQIILDDPAGNSYIQNLYAPDPDPELEVVHYERTEEQNDALGITDMKTEGYEVD
ncbi:zinc finger protein ZPR1-like isoform X2 [Acropora palmata]|uniref:zinc finger protein ZPR1-like isoform X2 n=1 Tax=Acropora palmata TaxID=6131 RepID=UPI003DA192A8